MCKFSGKCHFCATNGADHIAAIGDFFDAHAFTKAHLAEFFASGPVDETNVKFTAHLGLLKRDQGVLFQCADNIGGVRHVQKVAY